MMRSKVIKYSVITGVVTAVITTAAVLSMAVTTTAGQDSRVPVQTAGAVYGQNLIRFHVIANSDSDRDQALKRRVRDLVVDYMTPEFRKAASLYEARRIALEHQDEIREIALREIRNRGEDYAVKVQLGRFNFPVKTYGNLTLPAGNYEAVRVVIGRGQGANWWCVLFPPLCFVDVSRAVSPSDIQDTASSVYMDVYSPDRFQIEAGVPQTGPESEAGIAEREQRMEVRFKLLEWLGWE